MNTPYLIALNWGTSPLRAYLLGLNAKVLATQDLPLGLMRIPKSGKGISHEASFEKAFRDACGVWLDAKPSLPVIISGMASSIQGWHEAPYLETPVNMAEIVEKLSLHHTTHGQPLHIVPGLIQHGAMPNVMRGEEAQVAGVLCRINPNANEQLLIAIPGTHSKWIYVQNNRIEHFTTFMMGEIYNVLRKKTTLDKTIECVEELKNDDIFLMGVRKSRSINGREALLSTVFSAQTFGLTGTLSSSAQDDYISGLLIGHELREFSSVNQWFSTNGNSRIRIILSGNRNLCWRYISALHEYGERSIEFIENSTHFGLWSIAKDAGLLPFDNIYLFQGTA